MELSFTYDNILLVDGEFMQIRDTSPERLRGVLKVGHAAIIEAIDNLYQKAANNAPFVQRGSVFVIKMADNEVRALSEQGLESRDHKPFNRGTYEDVVELKPKYHPYWQVVEQEGFIPIARQTYKADFWLAVRDTPLKVIDT
jgi:hypothetical protein